MTKDELNVIIPVLMEEVDHRMSSATGEIKRLSTGVSELIARLIVLESTVAEVESVKSEWSGVQNELRAVREGLEKTGDDVLAECDMLAENLTAKVNDKLSTVKDGRDGRDGITGPPGETGPPGRQGDAGATGLQGPPGIQGERGFDGKVGLRGPTGDKGDSGTQGLQGPKGEQGERGFDGKLGPVGQKGDQGPQGEQGVIGNVGPPGPQGDIGQTGAEGPVVRIEDHDMLGFIKAIHPDGTDIIIQVAPVQKGNWSAEERYSVGDTVTHNGSRWRCIVGNRQDEPGTSAAWHLDVQRGQRGSRGRDGKDAAIEDVALQAATILKSEIDSE